MHRTADPTMGILPKPKDIRLSKSISAPSPGTTSGHRPIIVNSSPHWHSHVQGRRKMQIDLARAVASRSATQQQLETELVQSIAHGDRRAMHVLFARHRLRVYRFALRLVVDKEAAEDLVSEVFLQVWRHAGRFEGRCRVSSWLLAITRNMALSMLRRRPMEALDGGEAAAVPDHADDPEAVIQKKQQSAILGHCLTKLSPAHREVIDLVYYHGRSVDEVAAIIHVPPSTVKTRMFYARYQIAKLLNPFGMHRTFPTPEASACKRQARVARHTSSDKRLHPVPSPA
jgi:RNA polymerase sigma-70 factor (ECF subfamily)